MLTARSINSTSRSARAAIDADVGITAVVLASADGFAVSSATRFGADASRIAALASSMASIASVAAQEAGLGRCTSLTLNTDSGFAVMRQLKVEGMELVLIMVADGSALLAQVVYQAHQFEKEVAVL